MPSRFEAGRRALRNCLDREGADPMQREASRHCERRAAFSEEGTA